MKNPIKDEKKDEGGEIPTTCFVVVAITAVRGAGAFRVATAPRQWVATAALGFES